MVKIAIIGIALFILVTFLFWKLSVDAYKKEYSEKARKVGGASVYYWQAVVIFSGGITFGIMALLKWANILVF